MRKKAIGAFLRSALLLVPLTLVMTANQTVRAEEVDLEIVLAMDGSGSISPAEFELQILGTAAALRDPAIQQAILSGPTGRVAIAAVVWSDAAFPKRPTPWHLLDAPASIDLFAQNLMSYVAVAKTGKRQGIGGGGTGIGDGVIFAIEMIRTNAYDGLRKVVDVSGDGVETDPWFKKAFTLPDARKLAAARQITVNGLAILTDNWKLDEYYRDNVIHGPGAFVIKATDFNDFARAIRDKLWRETSQSISRINLHEGYRYALVSP